jgi:plastocyanin
MWTSRAVTWAFLVAAAGPAWAGDLTGIVRFLGTAPPTAVIETTKDRAVCGPSVEDESLLVSDGRLANVVVVVKGGPTPAPAQVTLDQRRCRYHPHVQAAPAGSTLEILNGDELLHSVHGWAGHATRFDVVTPSKGIRAATKLDRPGLIQVRCDVHGWMRAYIMVADGPAAVTGPDGTFTIRDLPAGSYVLAVWHERLGEKTAQISVPARGTVRADLDFGG